MKTTIFKVVLLLSILVPVHVSAQSSVKYLSDLTPTERYATYFFPQHEKTFRMGGVSYSHGFYIYTTFGPTRHGYAQFDLKGTYKTFNFILGTSPTETNLIEKGIFVIYLDGRKVVDKVMDPHGVQERMTLDVSGANTIRFEIIKGEVTVCIAEPSLWTASQTARETGEVCPVKGDKPVKLTRDLPPYQTGPLHKAKAVSLNSKSYDNGLLFQANMGMIDNNLCTTHFNLGGRFSRLAFLYGPGDSSQGALGKGWLAVRCDGKLVTELEVGKGDIAKKAVLDITGCRHLTFETENEYGSLNIVATEIMAYPEGFEPEGPSNGEIAVSAEAAAWPNQCKLMSTIIPYAVGGGVTRETSVFDGKSEHFTFSMGGVKFSEGLILRASSNILNDNTHSHAAFNLEKQFDYISFTTGWISKCGVLKNDTLRIYADEQIVFEMPQIATSPNMHYEVPIYKCSKLMFELEGRSSLSHPAFGIADIVLYRGEPVENNLFRHPTPELPDRIDLIDLGAPYIHYVPTMKDWPEKIFYDGSTVRKYFDNGGERINKGFMLQTSVHFDLEMGPGSDPGVGVMAVGMGASLMVGAVGGVTISAVFPFGCLLALASGGTALESSCAAFNTYGAYDYVTFTVASLNPSINNRKETLIIGGDGQVITELEVYEQMSPRTFTVPVNRCSQLMFWLKCGDNTSGKYIFYNLQLGRGDAPEAAVPVINSAKGNTPSVAATPAPYFIPTERTEWTDIEWTSPSSCRSEAVNRYFADCRNLRNDIIKFHNSLKTDYQTKASYVKSSDGETYREITIESSYGEKFTFSDMLDYDRQVIQSIKNLKMRFTSLAVSQTAAVAGMAELGIDLLKYTKPMKETGSMTNALKKQLSVLEEETEAEISLLEELISAGLSVDGISSDDSRIFIR